MIDIHCHILPRLDDGAPSLDVAMAAMAAKAGITDIVATPHASPASPYDPLAVSGKVAELQACCPAEITILGLHYTRSGAAFPPGRLWSVLKTNECRIGLVEFAASAGPEKVTNGRKVRKLG